jgi:NTP pyrophosphatase (non-canonical NTP hydrolase)
MNVQYKIDVSPILGEAINAATRECHGRAKAAGWWNDLSTGEPLERNKGELIALIHSEVSEVLEGVRKNTMDDHLPHRKTEEVEMADILIRVFDYAGAYGLDIGGALVEKLNYNLHREDHKRENRAKPNGKKI